MRKLSGVLAALLLLAQVGGAFAQQSDYEVIDSFKKKSQALSASLKTVQDVRQCAALEADIGKLQAEYAPNKVLLAEGLYPSNFDAAMNTLRDQAQEARERIRKAEESRQDKAKIVEYAKKSEADTKTITEISRQNTEYQAANAKLTQEIKELGGRIQQLTTENTGLIEQVKSLQAQGKKDRETIAKLQALNEKLNANIRDRDALVIKMMDSLFAEYGKGELTDAQKKDLFVSVQGKDYVGRIVSTLDGNVKYAETALFSAQDLKAARDEERKLAAKWDEIKPFVAKIYPDEQSRVRDIATVDGRIADWNKSIDATAWKSIHQLFVTQGVDIGLFATAAEFHARLLAYVDAQTREPSRERFLAFKEKVWDSPLKDQWLPLIPNEELSAAQRAGMDQRVAAWAEAISAQLRKRALLGVLAAAVLIGLAVALLRRKKPAAS
jgi:predicted  nucleic acid-binding Zn-ribbon protein